MELNVGFLFLTVTQKFLLIIIPKKKKHLITLPCVERERERESKYKLARN